MDWNFTREESTFSVIPEGKYRIRVNSVEKKQSSTGKDMIVFKFDVSGQSGFLFYNLVFLPDKPQITNRNLTQFFDSFKDIPSGDFTLANWVGKVGACTIKHEEYNGNLQARLGYFISADKQDDIPAWQEPKRQSESVTDGFVNTPSGDMEIPF